MSHSEIEIKSIQNFSELEPYLPSLCQTYQIVFATPPYNERFYPNEVHNLVYNHLQGKDQSTLLAVKGERVVGFGLASPVKNYPDIARRIRGLLPVKQTYYLVDLGVLPDCRRKGLAKRITDQHMIEMNTDRYNYIVLRSSFSEDPAHFLFQNMGFEDMGVYMDIHSRKTDGSTRTDQRMILSKMVNDK